MNYKYTSASRCRVTLTSDDKNALRLAVCQLQDQHPYSNLPEEITNHVKVSRRKIYGTVNRVFLGEAIGQKERKVLEATLHWGRTLVG